MSRFDKTRWQRRRIGRAGAIVLTFFGFVIAAYAQSQPASQASFEAETRPVSQPQTAITSESQTAPAGQPQTTIATQPQSAPASQPATAPASQPATAPTSQPQSAPAEGPKPLTWEAVYGDHPVDFDGQYARGMIWLDDGQYYLHRRDGELMRIDALTDEAEPAYDYGALEAALRASPDFDEREAKRLTTRPDKWSADRSALLIEHAGGLYFYRLAERKLRALTADRLPRRVVDLSPHGDAVSFVRDNDLYVIDTRRGKSRRLTRDGSGTVLNGVLDWVYQEEVFGRSHWRASWWRDDAEYLAFLRLDDARVPLYPVIDYIPHIPAVQQTRYPQAGDPNPTVRLGIARRATGRVVWADLDRYDGSDILIVRVSWSPDSRLIFSVQDREQRWLELNEADPRTGRVQTLLRETSPAWTNDIAHPHWLADGSFLWLSERDGYRHIFRYARDAQLLRRVTGGAWSVRSLTGYDANMDWVYFTGSRETVFETQAYRVPLAGGQIEQLTTSGFNHSVNFDPTFRFFFDTFSGAATPTKVHLCNCDGALVRVVSENEVKALEEYVWSAPEALRIPNRNGFLLNVQMIRPPDFDPARRYPVLCPVYGGPGAQTIHNRWGGRRQLFEQYLAQQGYLIFRIDPHSACGEGAVSAWQAYCRLGENELADIEDALHWLIDQGYADADRIGITGYSYGGYATTYALTHSTMFRVGIAGAPPADWRDYDSIYTERYMQTPEHDPNGYARASVSNAAADLHGRLLIVHGLLDDNVHFQNSAQLIDALQQAGKMFDLMVYPLDRHGIDRGEKHFRELRRDYILGNL